MKSPRNWGVLLFMAIATAHAQFNYNSLTNPWYPSFTAPSGISGNDIVGYYYDSGGHANGFLFNGTTWATIDYTSSSDTTPQGIDGTNIVGFYGKGFGDRPFLYNGSSWVTINIPGASYAIAYGVSGCNVVGMWGTGAQVSHGFIYNMCTQTIITNDDPAACTGTYQGTINRGIAGTDIVGSYEDCSSLAHGFHYSMTNNVYTTIDYPGATQTIPVGISAGQITGYYFDSQGNPHGFLYNGTTWGDIDIPNETQVIPSGIYGNEIVGSYTSSNNTYGFLTGTAATAYIVTNFAIASGHGNIAVNPNLNKIYCSGGASAAAPIVIVDGSTFSTTTAGSGMGADVDLTNNNYWSGGVYSDNVTAWSSANADLASPSTGSGCAFECSVDSIHRRVWVGAQCGNSIWVFDADTYTNIASINLGGNVLGPLLVNPATGWAYCAPGSSMEINPANFTISAAPFAGYVYGVNTTANLLYAGNNNTLQIINGAVHPETVLTNVSLGFPFGSPIGVNAAANRIYLGAANANYIVVLNATNGALLEKITLDPSVTSVANIAADPLRGRVYASAFAGGVDNLYVIQDLTPPTIISGPVNTTVATGGAATLSVSADGYPVSYQWSFDGTNIAGATGSSLTLGNVSAATAGLYTVTIDNGLGQVTSQPVSLGLVDLKMFAGVVVTGPSGAQYSIQSTSKLTPTNWMTLTNVTLASQPYVYIDYSSPGNSSQFYRAVPLAP